MKPEFRAINGPRLILGVFIFLIIGVRLFAAEGSGQNFYVGATDFRHGNLIELFIEEGFTLADQYHLTQQQEIVESLITLSIEDNFDIGLITAVCRFEHEYFPAETRKYQFNLENGLTYSISNLPTVWEDINRVIHVLHWVREGYEDGDIRDIIAYYIYGKRYCGDVGYDALNDEMKSDIDQIISDGDRYGELINTLRGPVIIDVVDGGTENAVIQYGGTSSSYTSDEIMEAYISIMLYYNPKLDREVATQILDAIAYNISLGKFPDIDARFVMALIANESGFNPDSVSHVGAMGLGQLMPGTVKKYGVDDPFDVTENIGAIFGYLQNEFNRWADKEHIYDYVIASYNAGAGAVSKYGGIPPYEETVNFVYRVTKVFKNYLSEEEYDAFIYGKSKHYPDAPEQGTS